MKKEYLKPESTWKWIGGVEPLADTEYGNWGSQGADGEAWNKGENEGTSDIWGNERGTGIWDNPLAK